ncbi:hypothetical protein [Azospira restricta]|uniref:Uncharacterized protein n=1 Tax=Azospira restricta TaxID=404405 RepID=A0A974SR46_9RHOO|nr:hypothetical protein [Azospira restricta]QRJ64958.1 hypothetical protein IWH25_06350 [Azospira restricta]
MVFDVSVAMTWLLFLALFPMAFYWLRRVWRIVFRRDYSEVALKRGEPPADAAKYAPYTAAINFVAGLIAVSVILMVVVGAVPYETWTAIAGSTIWMKFFADFIVSRHAHPIWAKKGKEVAGAK